MQPMRFVPLALPLLALTACVQVAIREEPVPSSQEIVKPTPPVHDQEPAHAPTPSTSRPSSRATEGRSVSAPPAVMALLDEAQASSSAGRLDNAAATLERAIRIQPRSALLWQRLAEVRLQQHQPDLAENLAKKSNLLARGQGALTRKNWQIIADARRQKGDAEGAADADAKAGR
ncbi:MAG: tetratricopeptide repeat protein [Methylococcaceae bacterium]|nr:tetratricopeptide repeat protein [Methylococcaceae bacterium]